MLAIGRLLILIPLKYNRIGLDITTSGSKTGKPVDQTPAFAAFFPLFVAIVRDGECVREVPKAR
jgi:hypothetical protein